MIFELSWGGYDGSYHWLFEHDDKTQEDFQKDCNELLVKYGDEYMESEDGFWVGASDWVEYIVGKLPERGYEPVEPIHVYYPELSVLRSGERVEWEPIVGKRLMDKAIDHNFMASLSKNCDIFVVDSIYHTRDCLVLLGDRSKRVWAFKWSAFDRGHLVHTKPCEVCKPEKP